jgi:formate-dependent nitrite reductase membrane component NrfD
MASPAIHTNATYHLIAPNTESAFSNTPGLPALAIAAGSADGDAALLIAICVVVAARPGRNAGGGDPRHGH